MKNIILKWIASNGHGTILFMSLMLVCFSTNAQQQTAEDTLTIDLDKDKLMDTVVFLRMGQVIVAKLSSQKFKPVKSTRFENIELTMAELKPTTTGFIFGNNWMRAGYECQFRYEPDNRRIRLIGMTRYEFGNAAGDGSGKSSVNLLTNTYAGDWNYMDYDNDKLIKIPTIKKSFSLPKTYLDDNVEKAYETYAAFCSDQYNKTSKKMMKAKRK